MSNNNRNTNSSDKTGDIMSWVIIFILMFVLPPAGWVLLFIRLGVLAGRNKKKGKKHTVAGNEEADIIIEESRPKSKIVRNRKLDKKTGKGISVLLTIVSICLFLAGITMTIEGLSSLLSGYTFFAVRELGFGIFWLISGFITFFSRNTVAKRFSRYKNYFAFISGRGVIPLYEIAQVSGKSQKVVTRDIQAMINRGYLGSSAYIDYELESLVLSAKDADKLREELRLEVFSDITGEEQDGEQLNIYTASLTELREANSLVKDETISKKVTKLEELTEKIFKIVEDYPEKQQQLKRFMNYYLPTTLKLVRSYATLEKQGVVGENIISTKESIGNVLDTLTTGFEQQLDQLFKSDAMDIATDISVLENLMQQDGLTGNKPEFEVAQSGTF